MIQAAKPAMTASIKVASRALNSSRFSCRQESFISFTVWHSDPSSLFNGKYSQLFLKARDEGS